MTSYDYNSISHIFRTAIFIGIFGVMMSGCSKVPNGSETGDILFWNGSTWEPLARSTNSAEVLTGNRSGTPQWKHIQDVLKDVPGYDRDVPVMYLTKYRNSTNNPQWMQ